MTDIISQDEINRMLWAACDTFRGTVDPAEYKNYILVMLFLKYISDVWWDRYDEIAEQYGDDAERIERRMAREYFVLPTRPDPDDPGKHIRCDYYALYDLRNRNNIGEEIDKSLEAVEDANKAKLDGVFRNITFNSEAQLGKTAQRNTRLKSLLQDFADPKLDMRPSRIGNQDVIGNAYEYLIERFAAGAGKKAGEFYTPAGVSTLLARLLDPQPGEAIYDPACGSGSLLIRCTEQVGSRNYAVYGQESNGSTWALAMMNMFIHNIEITHSNIAWGDTLANPVHLSGGDLQRFEVVVANPPFSLKKWGHEDANHEADGSKVYNRYRRGVPPKSRGDYAFLLHMVESTYSEPGKNGRVGVIVPHGVLFRGGAEGRIREALIRENLLDAVIGLPENLFFGTGIPAAILIFRRQRADDHVLFIDASCEYEPGTNQNRLRAADLDHITRVYRARAEEEKYSYRAALAEIEENDFNLNIPRYVDTFEPESPVDMAAVNAEIRALRAELGEVEERMAAYLRELGLDE